MVVDTHHPKVTLQLLPAGLRSPGRAAFPRLQVPQCLSCPRCVFAMGTEEEVGLKKLLWRGPHQPAVSWI